SKLVADAQSNLQMTQVHEILTHVEKFVQKSIPGYRPTFQWDWAGDGGIFAFPADDPNDPTTEKVLNCALEIWHGIARMNDPYILDRNAGKPVHLHITLGQGRAYYVVNPGLRRSHALNVIMKLKAPSRQTTIIVSSDIMEDLPPERKAEFIQMRLEPSKEPVFAYAETVDSALRNLAAEHARYGETMESAHCSYRVAALNLGIGERSCAIAALEECLRQMDATPPAARHRQYWLTLRSFYAAWIELLSDGPRDVIEDRWEDRRALLRREEVLAWFRSSPGRARAGNLLTHLEFILEQLDILAQKVVNDPSGLTTLEICLLLERCGYSRRFESHAIRERLLRIKAEMTENHSRSIDGDCSICTGVAASCLLLAGDEQRANELLDWLKSLRPFRYAWIGSDDHEDEPPDQHALHYASAVLCAFADHSGGHPSRESERESVKQVLLGKEWMGGATLPPHWMRYRNISEFEVCSYILPSLVRYHLSGGVFDEIEKKRCTEVLNGLASALDAESIKVSTDGAPDRLYGARENVGSFALGLVPGILLSDEAEKIVRHGLARFEYRARRREARSTTREQTLDSNTDRTRKFLSGWLLQWEMILRSASPESLPRYARELLTVFGIKRT
ncbi:MAG TPA: hypothetical protein VF713_13845, partial [Thermoanaerobaculia bacterium]